MTNRAEQNWPASEVIEVGRRMTAMTTTYCFAIEINGKRNPELYETMKEAKNALAAWSLIRYQQTGNFDHDKTAKIVRVY